LTPSPEAAVPGPAYRFRDWNPDIRAARLSGGSIHYDSAANRVVCDRCGSRAGWLGSGAGLGSGANGPATDAGASGTAGNAGAFSGPAGAGGAGGTRSGPIER
jgi:hypothetical protein